MADIRTRQGSVPGSLSYRPTCGSGESLLTGRAFVDGDVASKQVSNLIPCKDYADAAAIARFPFGLGDGSGADPQRPPAV